MRRKVALKDIAAKVGVSTALVSYVLNGQAEEKQVSKDAAKKIMAAAKQMNYRPNQIAKSLKLSKTHTLGFIVADINYRFTTKVTRAIEQECQKLNYTVLLGSTNESQKRFSDLLNVLISRSVDGLIIVPVENCEKQIEYLNSIEIPFVIIDRILPNVEANIIAIDNLLASYTYTRHIIKTGHKKIGFISYKSALVNLQDRKNGYIKALQDHNLTVDENLVKEINSDDRAAGVRHAIDELISARQGCDAIFFATETLAVEGLRHINSLHIKVPEQIGVVSFDEADAFDLFYCPITHGQQPLEEIGRTAVNMLMESIESKKKPKKIFLGSDFHIGKSCHER